MTKNMRSATLTHDGTQLHLDIKSSRAIKVDVALIVLAAIAAFWVTAVIADWLDHPSDTPYAIGIPLLVVAIGIGISVVTRILAAGNDMSVVLTSVNATMPGTMSGQPTLRASANDASGRQYDFTGYKAQAEFTHAMMKTLPSSGLHEPPDWG